MVLGIISKSFAKDLTELLPFIIPFMIWNVVYYDRILYIMQKYYISDGGYHAHRKRGDPGSFEISLPAGTDYPSQAAAASEIISTQALLKLPKAPNIL